MKSKFYTLVFIKKHNKVLLGLKKRGFGIGKWNGYGGKLNNGETKLNAALRELEEESTLQLLPQQLKYLGFVIYEENYRGGEERVVFIYTSSDAEMIGHAQETEEMIPKWFDFKEIPYQDMWPDSKFWMPFVIDDLCLKAKFVYGRDEQIVNLEITGFVNPPLL